MVCAQFYSYLVKVEMFFDRPSARSKHNKIKQAKKCSGESTMLNIMEKRTISTTHNTKTKAKKITSNKKIEEQNNI